MNPCPASVLTPAERRAELCRILALGLLRLRQSTALSARDGESSLPFAPNPSGPATEMQKESR